MLTLAWIAAAFCFYPIHSTATTSGWLFHHGWTSPARGAAQGRDKGTTNNQLFPSPRLGLPQPQATGSVQVSLPPCSTLHPHAPLRAPKPRGNQALMGDPSPKWSSLRVAACRASRGPAPSAPQPLTSPPARSDLLANRGSANVVMLVNCN